MSADDARPQPSRVLDLVALVIIFGLALFAARCFLSEQYAEALRKRAMLPPDFQFSAVVVEPVLAGPWLSDRIYFATIRDALTIAMCVCCFGLLVLALLSSRFKIVDILSRPGTCASFACAVVMIVRLLASWTFDAAVFLSEGRLPTTSWTDYAVVRVESVASGVIAIWLLSGFARRSPIVWTWIEVTGVAIGVVWILSVFANAAFTAANGV